jgi:AraC family transcriptional regulator
MQLESPRFENGKPPLIAGLREHYTSATMKNIPDLWRRFVPYFGNVPGQVCRVAHGLNFKTLSSDGLDYVAGVEVSRFAGLPEEFSRVSIPAQKYAVFSHREHVSKVNQTCDRAQVAPFVRL